MAYSCRRRVARAGAVLGVLVCGAGLPACSGHSAQPPAATSSSAPPPSTTVMAGDDKHTITTKVDCQRAAAQTDANPPESGTLTTRITVRDDSASVSLALSDEQPPTVDGFGFSLTAASGLYHVPFQAARYATQVRATKDGNSYTVTGTGDGVSPNQGDVHPVTFGIHVTCP